MNLKNVSKTLFIPLLGKATISKTNIFLHDQKAEEIVSNINYDFNSLKESYYLSLFLSLRALLIDELCSKFLQENKNTTVIHLGCGLDSRVLRIKENYHIWYDIDYDEVIKIRKDFYEENAKYKMICSTVTDPSWLDKINKSENILVIAEGLTMYLSKEEIKTLIKNINDKFANVHLLFDAYTNKGVKLSKIKNPVNKLNAKVKFGFTKKEEFIALNQNLTHTNTHLIKRDNNNLSGLKKFIFNKIYCGKISSSLYKIYEFELNKQN